MNVPPEISVRELQHMHDAAEQFVLVDVREDDELATASLDFARHIPMGAIGERLDELPKDRPIVVMCHGGTRSGRVANFLRQNGFPNVANLKGGIDAWAHEIDPCVPRY